METQINSLAAELSRIEAAGNKAQASSDPIDMAMGVAVMEAITQARAIIEQAQKQASIAVQLAKGLDESAKTLPAIVPAISELVAEMKRTDGQLSAVTLAYQKGTEKQVLAFAKQLELHTASIKLAAAAIEKRQAVTSSEHDAKAKAVLNGLQETVKNLIQELDEGVKVELANQQKLPIAGFARGQVKRTDQAVPVMMVDGNGEVVDLSKIGGKGGGGAGFIGSTSLNDPLIEYRPSDTDESTSNKYYGFLTIDGRWYIIRESNGNTYRYFKGTGNYETASTGAWAQRTAHDYGYFHNVF